MVGEGAALLVQRALGAAGLDPGTPGALDRFLALYDERLLDTTRLYPGLRRALRALDPLLALAVLTNKPRRPTERLLEALQVRERVRRGGGRRRAAAAQARSRRACCRCAGTPSADRWCWSATRRWTPRPPAVARCRSCWPATASASAAFDRVPAEFVAASAGGSARRPSTLHSPRPAVGSAPRRRLLDRRRRLDQQLRRGAGADGDDRVAAAAQAHRVGGLVARFDLDGSRRASIRGARRSAGTPHPDR